MRCNPRNQVKNALLIDEKAVAADGLSNDDCLTARGSRLRAAFCSVRRFAVLYSFRMCRDVVHLPRHKICKYFALPVGQAPVVAKRRGEGSRVQGRIRIHKARLCLHFSRCPVYQTVDHRAAGLCQPVRHNAQCICRFVTVSFHHRINFDGGVIQSKARQFCRFPRP